MFSKIKESDMNFKPVICTAMLMAFANPVLAVSTVLVQDETILTAPKNEDESYPKGEPLETITTSLDTLDNNLDEMGYYLGVMIKMANEWSSRPLPPTLLELEAAKNG